MKLNNSPFLWLVLIFILIFFTGFRQLSDRPSETTSSESKANQLLDSWTYIEVDNSRAKWGDWDKPDWLRYFGLDMEDITGNGYKDIVAGRYFYRNPGGNMTAKWERIDLGMNVDGMLFIDADGDEFGDIIATALPDVYWFEAQDKQGSSWKGFKIGEVPATSHVNGQGYATAQIVQGGKEEILLATGEGIFYFEIPGTNPEKGNWPVIHAAPEASDEGFGIGDIDGDELLDIVAGLRQGEDEGSGMEILWWKNTGNTKGDWKSYSLGSTKHDADRIAVADINGNGKPDIVVTEERYPGKQPDASLYWFEQPSSPTQNNWHRHKVVTQYSMNNLDVADMDGIGHNDIITAEHKGTELEVQIWKNDGKGNFTKTVVDKGKESHLGSRVADLNGNGAMDIVSIGWDQYEYLHIWRNDNKVSKATGGMNKNDSDYYSFKIEHVVQGYLGPNHLANLVYRKGIDGDKFVGWGRYPLTEWEVGSAAKKQVVPTGENQRYTNGGCAMDITGDGIDEIITARGEMSNLANSTLLWFKEVEGKDYWEEHEIASIWPGGYTSPHDIVPYIKKTASGNEFKAVLANKGRKEMHLFVVPENPQDEWPHYVIGNFPVNAQSGLQLADINKDGNVDIVSGNFWIEAPDDPTDVPWEFHRFCKWDEMGENYFGGMNYHAVADFTGDGFQDMIVVEAEIPDSRISLFVRSSDDGTGLWEEIPLEGDIDVPHSLLAIDLNSDNKMDFIVGEMTAGGWNFPLNPNPKLFAYINKGDANFDKITLYEGWGMHEMRLFPKPFEGKIMVYAADEIQPQKFYNMNTHVSYWLISKK